MYVIYTSGRREAEGRAVRHRNLVNYADFISKRLELRNILTASDGFDAGGGSREHLHLSFADFRRHRAHCGL